MIEHRRNHANVSFLTSFHPAPHGSLSPARVSIVSIIWRTSGGNERRKRAVKRGKERGPPKEQGRLRSASRFRLPKHSHPLNDPMLPDVRQMMERFGRREGWMTNDLRLHLVLCLCYTLGGVSKQVLTYDERDDKQHAGYSSIDINTGL